jgi:hypothetical protein
MLPAGTRRVTLAAGRNALSVPMPRLQTVVVSDPDGKPGQSFALRPESGASWSRARAKLDGDRRAVFAALPEGRYQLRRESGPSDGAMRVAVPGPAEIVFRPTPYNAMRVFVTDPDGAWARAGLADGDLIVAIDGNELESLVELETTLAATRPKDAATFGVLRGAARLELRVSPKELFGGGGGGRIEWATR